MLAHLQNDALRFRLPIDRGTASNAMVRYYLTSVAECGCIVSNGEESDEQIALVERHAGGMGPRVWTADDFHNERPGELKD